jgi:hypothetical protein
MARKAFLKDRDSSMTHHFLRSVSIKDDLGVPSRFDHYHPTSRSLPVARAVLSGGATMVIAAYGSGKSLAAGIGAIAVANETRSHPLLHTLIGRIKAVDAGLAEEFAQRIARASKGRVVTLSGYVRDLSTQLSAALGLGPVDDLSEVLTAATRLKGVDRISIVWDEFGRHLEGLVTEGRARDLDAIQRLAEWTARAKSPSAGLTLLLHQNLLAYAGNLNQTTRNEWRKVEGRFETIRFVEDSRELYSLIAAVVARRRTGGHKAEVKTIERIAQDAAETGWFDGMDDVGEVARLLTNAHPMSAGALQILPRLVARVGQNERSLFAFIEGVDLASPIGMEEVYAAFSEAMRTDVGVGGVHRRWIEAESARSKAANAVEREIIAAAFLLQLGAFGERRHLPRSVLELAARSKGYPTKQVREALDALIGRKLILYRKLNDDVSIWHGADVDIASKLRDERMRRYSSFDLLAFLDRQHPASFIRPVRHNAVHGTTRHLAGSYATAASLRSLPPKPGTGAWGRIIYVICHSSDDVREAHKYANEASLDRTILVVPQEPIPILDAALEVEALSALRRDETLLSEDPLVAQELDELIAVARRHLSVILHRLTTDRPASASWYAGRRKLKVSPDRPAGVAISDLMDEWFSLTPRIANDQVMRASLSRQMQTARIRMVMRLMEHSTTPMLGYCDDGSAEASIYRTVLLRTGLHREENGIGCFARPEELADEGMSQVWGHVRDFFSKLGSRPLTDIIDILSSPPFGLPPGVIPIIVMAGYRAFGRAVSIWTDGSYVSDVLGFDSTRMFLEPSQHNIEVHTEDESILEFLDEVCFIFSHHRPGAHDERVRATNDAVRAWRSGIADGAVRSRRLTDNARVFLRKLNDIESPADFLIEALPTLFGGKAKGKRRYKVALEALEEVRDVIDGLVDGYLREAVDIVTQVLRLNGSEEGIKGVQSWVSCLDVETLMKRDDVRMTDKAILRTARETLNGRHSPEMLARAVSSILLQRGIEKWQDDTKEQLRKELRECRLRLETAALDVSEPPKTLAPIIESRIQHLKEQLARINGTKEAGH